jgi:hypothetical protein
MPAAVSLLARVLDFMKQGDAEAETGHRVRTVKATETMRMMAFRTSGSARLAQF